MYSHPSYRELSLTWNQVHADYGFLLIAHVTKRVSGSQQCLEEPGSIRTAMGRVRSAEFLVPDLRSCRWAGGLKDKWRAEGHTPAFAVAHGHRLWSPAQRKQEWR